MKTQTNTINLSYQLSGQGDQTVVLIHGLGGSAQVTYGQVIPHLAEYYRVLAFDNRGVGGSDQPANEVYSLAECAHDTYELLKALGIEQAHIVGHSFGGMIAQQFAVDYPEMALSLVLADCPGEMSETSRQAFETRARAVEEGGMAAIVEAVIQNGLGREVKERHPEVVAAFRNSLLESAPLPYAASCRGATRLNLLEQLRYYNRPVLVVWGDQDKNPPREATEKLAASFRQSRFEVIAQSGHNSPIEEPEEFSRKVLAFLKIQPWQ